MARLIMTRGLPGSGKSTWARELCDREPGRWKLVDKDGLRKLLDNGRWSKHNEKFVLKIRDHIISEALADDINVIVHDTNFEPIHEQRLRELAKGHQFNVKEFDVPIEECIKCDLQRLDSVGEKVIRGMWKKYLRPEPMPLYGPQDLLLPKAIIVDLDGTLANLNGRNPYDASTCEKDLQHFHVADAVRRYPDAVVLCSGREDKYRAETERWLERCNIPYEALFMRKTDDQRKDSIIKREIFDNEIRGKWMVEYVIDDRQQVVDMWRSELGLVCWQVAEGDF